MKRVSAREDIMNYFESTRPSIEPEEEPEAPNDDQTANIPQPSIATPVPQPVINTISQPLSTGATSAIRLSPVTDPTYITPVKLQSYESLLVKARQYEERYKLVDDVRKKQLAARLREIINKLRTDTFVTLTDELFRYLNSEEQKANNQPIRINNDEGNKCRIGKERFL